MSDLFIIILTAAVYTVFAFSAARARGRLMPQSGNGVIAAIFLAAAAARTAAALLYPGYATDMQCFSAWADIAYKDGLYSFYTNGIFSDYPPGYIYVLYIIGFIKNIFNPGTEVFYFLLKTPAMLCDFLCALVIMKTAQKNRSLAAVCAALFLFNPAVIINSAVWGQVDSVFTLFVLLSIYCIYTERLYPAYFLFAAAVFIKPQALFYTPVVAYAFFEQVFAGEFSAHKMFRHIFAGLSAILMMVLLALPFNISAVISQYRETLGSYNYASVNAYNLWTALGLNWHEPNVIINAAGYLFIVLTVIYSAVLYFSGRRRNRCFFVSSFICFAVFMLSVKMHDRYAYPAIPLMLCAYAVSEDIGELILYLGITFFQFVNAAHVLFYYTPETYYSTPFGKTAVIISIAAAVFFAAACIYAERTKHHE